MYWVAPLPCRSSPPSSTILTISPLAAVLLLIVLFFKEKPKGAENTEIVVGKKSKKARGVGWVGMDYDQAKKKPYFYWAIVAIFLTGISLNGIGNMAAPHLYDLGFEKPFVANIGTVTNLCLMGTKIGTGFLYDRKGIKVTMNICFVCAFVSLGGLILLDHSEVGKVLVYVRGIAGTIALPLETVMISIFASEIFGDKSFVKVLGVFSAANYAGLALGSPFVNKCYDLFDHSYNVSFAILAVFMIIAMTAMNFVIRAAHKDKKQILASLSQAEQQA